jgi:hypothetical protein
VADVYASNVCVLNVLQDKSGQLWNKDRKKSNITSMLAGKCLSNGKEPSDVKLSQPG